MDRRAAFPWLQMAGSSAAPAIMSSPLLPVGGGGACCAVSGNTPHHRAVATKIKLDMGGQCPHRRMSAVDDVDGSPPLLQNDLRREPEGEPR
jgi:hypothetical protein